MHSFLSMHRINMHLIMINSTCNIYVCGLLQVKLHKAMWCNGHKFRKRKFDEMKKTSYCGITTVFEVTKVSSRSDKHPKPLEN